MIPRSILILPLLALALSSCARTPVPTDGIGPENGRAEVSMMRFDPLAPQERALQEQAQALEQAARALVWRSTGKGMAIGATLGCGAALIGAGDTAACATGAVGGGAIGAVAGNIAGRAEVARRVEKLNTSGVVKDIRQTRARLDTLTHGLPQLLADQKAELNALSMGMAQGAVSRERYDTRRAEIAANRAALADTLTTSAGALSDAVSRLQTAQTEGHTGLDWHISATRALERDLVSARSSISLL